VNFGGLKVHLVKVEEQLVQTHCPEKYSSNYVTAKVFYINQKANKPINSLNRIRNE